MSELKPFIESFEHCIPNGTYYRKSEADKVIAELKSDIADLLDDKKLTDAILDERNAEIADLEKEIDELQDKVTDLLLRDRSMALNFNNAVDNLVHNKHKRCVAMAKWCKAEQDAAFLRYNWDTGRYADVYFYEKWHKRWLELAEKFKEAK